MVVFLKSAVNVFNVNDRVIDQFADRDGRAARTTDLREEISEGLEFSNLFKTVDAQAFLGEERTRALDGAPSVVCSDWKQIGADALLEGEVWNGASQEAGGEALFVEYRVWDVAACRTLARKRYRGGAREARKIARRIADDVVARLGD